MSESVGFGVIGACGNIGQRHVNALEQVDGAHLVAVADTNTEELREFPSKYQNVRIFHDYRNMLEQPDVQAVCICTPSGKHLDAALACAEAKKHMLCEKPLEITTSRVDLMIEAAAKAGVLLSGVLQNRFTEATRHVKNALAQERFGTLCLGNAYVKWHRTREYYESGGGWRGTWKLDGGGALMNQSIHQIDLLLWFMGSVIKLFAKTANFGHPGLIEAEDIAVAMLQFANGAFGTIEGSTALYPGRPAQVAIYGTNGCAVIEDGAITVWDFRDQLPIDEQIKAGIDQSSVLGSAAGDPVASLKTEGHRRQIEAFVAAINGQAELECDGYECRKAVNLVEHIYAFGSDRELGVHSQLDDIRRWA